MDFYENELEIYSMMSEMIQTQDYLYSEQLKTRSKAGRPPKTLENPLTELSHREYMDHNGRALIWLDDVLTGAIRAFGTKDKRSTTTKEYVGLSKLCNVLFYLPGELTAPRIAFALSVSTDTAWRIFSVLEFAAPSIKRTSRQPHRVISYRFPRTQNVPPTPSNYNETHRAATA